MTAYDGFVIVGFVFVLGLSISRISLWVLTRYEQHTRDDQSQ